MGLIKQAAASPAVLRFSLRDVEAQAQMILDDARREAARIIREAKDEASDLEHDSVAIGYHQGWTQGVDKGKDAGQDRAFHDCGPQVQAAIEALTSAADAMAKATAELESDLVNDAVELSIAIAERITRRAGLIDPAVLAENLREAMKLAARSNRICIAIHPRQMELLQQLLPALKMDWPAMENAQIVADETVSCGGCRVATSHGQVNADLQAQLDRIALKLLPQENAERGS